MSRKRKVFDKINNQKFKRFRSNYIQIKNTRSQISMVVSIIAYIKGDNKTQETNRFSDSIQVAKNMFCNLSKCGEKVSIIFITNRPELYKHEMFLHFEEVIILESFANNPNTRRGNVLEFARNKYSSVPIFLCDGRRTLNTKSDFKNIISTIKNFSEDGNNVGFFKQQHGFAKFNIWCATQVLAFKPPIKGVWNIPKCFYNNPGCIFEDFVAIVEMIILEVKFVKLDGRKLMVGKKKRKKTKSLLRGPKGIRRFKSEDIEKISFLQKKKFLRKLNDNCYQLIYNEEIMYITKSPHWSSHWNLIKYSNLT